MDNEQLPSIWRIIDIDYIATVAALAPVVGWFLYLFFNLIGRDNSGQLYLTIALAASVIGLIVLALRVLAIRRLFENGQTIPGKIEYVYFNRDRGTVRFTYIYQGEEYRTNSAIHRCSRTLALQAGAPVRVVVEQNNPKYALIRDLFL
jgi:hypothetical protein